MSEEGLGEIHKRFPATRKIKMIVTSTDEATAKYPPGSLKRDPRWLRPACTEEDYKAAMFLGVKDAQDGKPREACPYDASTDVRADAWQYGWGNPE